MRPKSHICSSALREVVLVPNRQWGGEGLLGCVFGLVHILSTEASKGLKHLALRFGLLHRIPPQPADRLPGTTPPELHEPADDYEQQELFVPADVHPETQYNPAQLAEWRRQEQEQEQWNRESLATRSMYEQTNSQQDSSSVAQGIQDETLGHGSNNYAPHRHDHEHYLDDLSNAHFTSQGTPHRPSSSLANSTTPTRTSLGTLMNGDSSPQS